MDGWLKPQVLLEKLKLINESNGVKYVADEIAEFETHQRRISSALTSSDLFEADEFILSAGAASPLISKKLKHSITDHPGKGYNLTSKTHSIKLKRPIYMTERKVVATPWKNAFRIGSTMEFSGYNLDLNSRRIKALKDAASSYLDIDLNQYEFEQ